MLDRETGKQRSQRIEMDYYRQRSMLAKSKVVIAIVAFAVGFVVLANVLITGGGNAANPAPLTASHAAFEQNCSQCHQALTPIGADSVRDFSLLGVHQEESVQHTFEACTGCHNSESDPIGGHYREKLLGNWDLVDKNCAVCHTDHQGRTHDLTQVANHRCVECHSQINSVCSDPSIQNGSDNASITAFSLEAHGDFSSLALDDTGTVKFDHAQHLLPGQSAAGRDVMRLKDVEPRHREQYRALMVKLKESDPKFSEIDTTDEDLVQLDCASCHQLAGLPNGLAQSADFELGRHFKPISFDDHCSACHAMNPGGRTEKTLPVPHAATWTEMARWMRANYLDSRHSSQDVNPISIGPNSQSATRDLADTQRLLDEWESVDNHLRNILAQQCRKCHDNELVESDESILAAINSSQKLIPSRFLRHGIYDHAAHRSIDCQVCHDQVGQGDPASAALDQTKVMIRGIDSCVDCHRNEEAETPASLLSGGKPKPEFGGQSLWAPNQCTLCHRYHTHRELANQGAEP